MVSELKSLIPKSLQVLLQHKLQVQVRHDADASEAIKLGMTDCNVIS